LAQEQVRANREEDILAGIDQAAAKVRRKLGESLPSIEKYDRPIHEALSTASLEAFQAYANGERTVRHEGSYSAIPFFKRAIELDPEFAYAYAALGLIYGTAGEENLSAEYTKKAYELQAHVSEWEKYFISIQYCLQATGDLDQALQVGRMWVQNYPRERTAHNRLAEVYERLGNPGDAAAELEQARVLGGGNPLDLSRLSRAYMALDRWSDARAILLEAIRRSPQRPAFREAIYSLAFLQDDQKLLQEQVDWAMHKPEELAFLGTADTEAYFGRLAKARELSRLAEDYASRTDFKERAALLHAGEALREALFGNTEAAREQSRAALDAGPGPRAQVLATFALAHTGDVVRARELTDELRHKFPISTLVQNYWIPAIRAQIELASNNPAKAVELLRNTEPYELSSEAPMIPLYVRALAYLGAQQGAAAAAEFQKILQHRGTVGNSVVGALAHLGLAEALSVAGNNLEARAKYEQFLNLWKHADPGIPIHREAKSRFGL
jgi:eukaryotic-like serine/threonine-protein kinase